MAFVSQQSPVRSEGSGIFVSQQSPVQSPVQSPERGASILAHSQTAQQTLAQGESPADAQRGGAWEVLAPEMPVEKVSVVASYFYRLMQGEEKLRHMRGALQRLADRRPDLASELEPIINPPCRVE